MKKAPPKKIRSEPQEVVLRQERPRANLHQKAAYLPEIHRLLPQAADAERGVLSSFLLAPREIGALCGEQKITAEYFHLPAHALIYAAMMEMQADNKEIDLITVTQFLRDRKLLDQAGGAALITELFTFLPTAANAAYYVGIVVEKFTLREIIKVCTEYASRCYEEQDDVPNLLDGFEQAALAIQAKRVTDDGYTPIKEGVMNAICNMERMVDRKGQITGISTGFSDLDRMTDGLHGSEMVVIAARPSMGKTAIAMNIAEHIAIHEKMPVAIFSLEMTTNQLIQRMITGRARVNWLTFRNYPSDRDYPAITVAASQIADAPIYICDKHNIPINYLSAVLRRWVKKFGIKAAFIDYLQLLRGSKQYKGDNRQGEIAEISGGIKNLCKELKIPIVVLAQLNRDPDKRTGSSHGVPRLSDLRESGAIEQDADTVGLLYREEYYKESEEDKKEAEGKASLIIAKQRNGPVGSVALTFIKDFTRFENRARDMEDEPDPQASLL